MIVSNGIASEFVTDTFYQGFAYGGFGVPTTALVTLEIDQSVFKDLRLRAYLGNPPAPSITLDGGQLLLPTRAETLGLGILGIFEYDFMSNSNSFLLSATIAYTFVISYKRVNK